MKKLVIGSALSVLLVCAAPAQFGGLGGKIKEKLQKATETFTPWPPEEEQAIGDAAAAKMAAIFGFVDNEVASRYVNLVGAFTPNHPNAELAARAALDMFTKLAELNEHWKSVAYRLSISAWESTRLK